MSSANEAVVLLGTGTIRSLALTCRLFSAFKVEPSRDFSVEQVWTHSLRVARLAEHIARLEHSNNAVVEQAFTAGLLHDVGKLMLANSFGAQYFAQVTRSANERRALDEIENEVFGTDHAEVGACLLQLWGLPSPLMEAVLWHERPDASPSDGFNPLAAVHVANGFDHETHGTGPSARHSQLDGDWLERLNLGARLEVWRQHCLES